MKAIPAIGRLAAALAIALAAGLITAAVSLRTFVHLLPLDTPRISNVSLHWDVLLFTAAASVLTGLLFGIMPALPLSGGRRSRTDCRS